MVEHHLAKVRVAGSNPVSRSKYAQEIRVTLALIFYCEQGGVAKWLRRRSAKPLFIGSSPIAASGGFQLMNRRTQRVGCRGGGIW